MNRVETLWLAKMIKRSLEQKDYEGVEAIIGDIIKELEKEGKNKGEQ